MRVANYFFLLADTIIINALYLIVT